MSGRPVLCLDFRNRNTGDFVHLQSAYDPHGVIGMTTSASCEPVPGLSAGKEGTVLASRFGGVVSGLVCIVAGVYLLQTQSSGVEGNWLETIGHGMGIYFIGKGIFVWLSLNTQVDMAKSLRGFGASKERAD